jgi:hypothetical protein
MNENKPKEVGSADLLASLDAKVYGDHVILEPTSHIDKEQWYIKIIPSQIQLWEIPQYGGTPYLISSYPSINDAYSAALTLC